MSRCILQVSLPKSSNTPKWQLQNSGKELELRTAVIMLCIQRRLLQHKVTKILLKESSNSTCTRWLIATRLSLRANISSLSNFVTHGASKSGQVTGATSQISGLRACENSSKLRLKTMESSTWALRTTSWLMRPQVSAWISLRSFPSSHSKFMDHLTPSSSLNWQRNGTFPSSTFASVLIRWGIGSVRIAGRNNDLFHANSRSKWSIAALKRKFMVLRLRQTMLGSRILFSPATSSLRLESTCYACLLSGMKKSNT